MKAATVALLLTLAALLIPLRLWLSRRFTKNWRKRK